MIRPFGKSNFKCAEFYEDEENLLFLIICIWFGTCVVRSLKLALKGLNCRIPCHLFACHWIRIASIVLCFVETRWYSEYPFFIFFSVVLGIPFSHDHNTSRHFLLPVHIFSRYLGQFSRITPPKRSKEMPTSYQFISSVPFLTLLLHFPKLKKPLDHRRPPCCWGKTLA